jgi:adenylate kinase family enzyme
VRRVVVLGTSGSGKTTLARELSRRMRAPHIELDALHWEKNWTGAAKDVFRQRVEQAIAQETWALCGNYAIVRDLTLARADTAIWLDYPMAVVFTRVFGRTLRRAFTRELLWGNNRESLLMNFFSRESLFLWVIKSWRRHRRDYPKLLRSERCRHLRILRFRSPAETEAWLSQLDEQTLAPPSPIASGSSPVISATIATM